MMATATSRRARAPSRRPDPFDTSDIASPQAEKAIIAYGILAMPGRADELAAVRAAITAAGLGRECFTTPEAGDCYAALAEAYRHDRPTIADFSNALRANAADWEAAKVFYTDATEAAESGIAAGRLAAEAAAEILEAHARRRAMLAMADAVEAIRGGAAEPIALEAAAIELRRAGEIAAGRAAIGRRLRVRSAAEIEPKPIEWFWPQRISCGSLAIITGLPGLSKSLLTIDIAARITTGGRWPDGSGSAPRGGVLLFGTEDDPERVVVPRLIAADADRSLVRIVDGAEQDRQEWLAPVSIDRDIELMRRELNDFPECRAIIFDPLSQFVTAEENSNAQTRAALAPLVRLAQERNVAIIAVMHMNKKSDSMLVQRIAGASSYGQMARHILLVANDPNDPNVGKDRRRAMIVVKGSYGGENAGQMYRTITRSGDVPGIEWIAGTIEADAETFNPKPPGVSREYQEKRSDAVDALAGMLKAGPRPAKEVQQALEEMGYKRRQIDFAKSHLGVETYQEGSPHRHMWRMPSKAADGDAWSAETAGEFSAEEWGR